MIDENELAVVELNHSFVYDCPHCGTENFLRCVSVNLNSRNDNDREAIVAMYGEEMLDELDDDPSRVTFAHSTPNCVICRECKTKFLAAMNGLLPDDDEDGNEDQ